MKYRLYIDESGTSNYPRSTHTWDICLGLTGIIVSAHIYDTVLQPKLKEIRKLFTDDLDNLPVLHRDDITKRIGVFQKLKEPEFETIYNDAFLNLLKSLDFTACCVVIDKQNHKETYAVPAHPYHYCLALMLERYVGFLKRVGGTGDVMAESRGGNEDTELKKIYSRFYERGTEYRSPAIVQEVLTSREIKMKKKQDKIDGLELADLLAVPTKMDVLATFGRTDLRENFNKTIIDAIQEKYYRGGVFSRVRGYGKKII